MSLIGVSFSLLLRKLFDFDPDRVSRRPKLLKRKLVQCQYMQQIPSDRQIAHHCSNQGAQRSQWPLGFPVIILWTKGHEYSRGHELEDEDANQSC